MKSYRRMHPEELAELVQTHDVPEPVRQVVLEILWDLKQYEEELQLQNEELRRAALELERMAERYTVLFQVAPVGLVVVDAAGMIGRCNAVTLNLLRLARDEVEGHPLTVFLDRVSHAQWFAMIDQARQGRSGRGPLLLARERHPVLVHVAQAGPEEYLVALVDQGPEEAAREDQRRALASFRTLVDRTPLGLCITNPQGIFEYVNPAYCRLYGYSSSELLGQHFTLVVPPEYRQQLVSLHDAFIAGKEELRGEWEVVRKDGQRLHILADAVRIEGEDGQPRKVTFVMDITERVAAERLRQDIEAIVRHDLRAPLSGILGLSAILLESPHVDAEEREMLDAIHKAGRRMLRMLGESVSLVAMERGTYELKAQAVDVLSVIREVVADLEDLRRRKRLEIRQVPCGCPQALALGEEALLYSIMANVLRNAMEAAPLGSAVDVEVVCGPRIAVTISNPGAIPEDFLPRLFDKYATWGKQGGTGLGTYSARLMARVMGGDVVAISQGGVVRFTVFVPAAA